MPSNINQIYALNPQNIVDTWDNLIVGLADRGITYEDLKRATPDDHTNGWMNWVRCAVLPEDNINTPLRYHEAASNLASAAIGVRTPYAINWQQQPIQPESNPGANQQLGPSDMAIFSFDYSPLHILSFYDPNASYRNISYQWTWNGDKRLFFNPSNGRLRTNKAQFVNQGTNWAAHGPYLYCKRDDLDNRYFWVDAMPASVNAAGTATPSTVTISFPGHVATGSTPLPLFDVYLVRYFNGNPQTVQRTTVNNNSTTAFTEVWNLNRSAKDPTTGYEKTYSDYYCISVVMRAGPDEIAQAMADLAAGVEVFQDSPCSTLRHLALFEAEVLVNQWGSKGRINAQGIRVTDIAMLQYVNGQICGATAWDSYTWYDYYGYGLQGGRTFFDTVAQIPGAIVGDLFDGGYSFHKTTQQTDYNYRQFVSWDPDFKRPDDMWVPIETNRPVKIIACTAQNDNTAGNPTGGGASAYLTVGTMVEWIPPVGCVETRRSEFTREQCAAGNDALGLFPDFTSNDQHWSELATNAFQNAGVPILRAMIDAGTNKLSNWIGPKAAGLINSAGHGAVTAISKKLSRRKRGRN